MCWRRAVRSSGRAFRWRTGGRGVRARGRGPQAGAGPEAGGGVQREGGVVEHDVGDELGRAHACFDAGCFGVAGHHGAF